MYTYVRFVLLYSEPTQHCKAIILQLGFPGGASDKYPPAKAAKARHRFNSCVGKIPWGGHGNPLQYSCLENPMDRGAWWATVYQFSSVAQSCPTLCDRMNRSTLGLPVHHQLPEFTPTYVHRVSDAIQPSYPVIHFSSCPQFLPAWGSFPMSQLFAWGGQSTGVSALASFLPKKSLGWSVKKEKKLPNFLS